MSTQREKAEELRRLHAAPEPLVLVNAWDAASARIVAGAPGCRAIATASWSIAAARGFPDGEAIDARRDARRASRIVAERGRPAGHRRPRARLRRRRRDDRAGARGGRGRLQPRGLRRRAAASSPIEQHVAAVAAARAAGEQAGIPLVINARTDVFLTGANDMDQAVERARAYLAAGADCAFVPGVRDVATLEQLVIRIRGPVSVIGGAGSPPLAELARIGIARVSYGPGPLGVAMAALRSAAETLLAGGDPPAELAFRT